MSKSQRRESQQFSRLAPKSIRKSSFITCAIALTMLTMVNCSGDETIISSPSSANTETGALNYFPVQIGYTSTYIVTDANGVELRRESYSADSSIVFDGKAGVNWVQRDLSDGSILGSGVMYWNSDHSALFHAESGSQSSERLIRSPLSETSQWPRWYEPASTTKEDIVFDFSEDEEDNGGSLEVDTSSGANGADLDNDKDNPNGVNDETNPQLSSFPTKGASTFYVASLDDDLVVNAVNYKDCLQIVNANSNQTVNRYWYCTGVGLVKYALNASVDSNVGTENGTLLP